MLGSLLVAVLAASSLADIALVAPAPALHSDKATPTTLDILVSGYPDPVIAGTNFAYTITATNNGPNAVSNMTWNAFVLDGAITFESVTLVAGWNCVIPPNDATLVFCDFNFGETAAVGSSVFTLNVKVDPSSSDASQIVIQTSIDADDASGRTGLTGTTVNQSADLSLTTTDWPDPVYAGTSLAYILTATNAGPSFANSVLVSDTLPAGTTFSSLTAPAGWSCTTPAVGAAGTVSCSNASMTLVSAVFTLTAAVDAGIADGTILSNTAAVISSSNDPNAGNGRRTETTAVLNDSIFSNGFESP